MGRMLIKILAWLSSVITIFIDSLGSAWNVQHGHMRGPWCIRRENLDTERGWCINMTHHGEFPYRVVLNMMTSSNGNIFCVTGHCAGNSPVPSEFPAQRPVTRSFDVFFDLCLNKRLSKQSRGWWFEMPSRPLWRHCNDTRMPSYEYEKPQWGDRWNVI